MPMPGLVLVASVGAPAHAATDNVATMPSRYRPWTGKRDMRILQKRSTRTAVRPGAKLHAATSRRPSTRSLLRRFTASARQGALITRRTQPWSARRGQSYSEPGCGARCLRHPSRSGHTITGSWDQSSLLRDLNGLRSPLRIQLVEESARVGLHRVLADEEFRRDLARAQPVRDRGKNLE